jgi:hypothetical protein
MTSTYFIIVIASLALAKILLGSWVMDKPGVSWKELLTEGLPTNIIRFIKGLAIFVISCIIAGIFSGPIEKMPSGYTSIILMGILVLIGLFFIDSFIKESTQGKERKTVIGFYGLIFLSYVWEKIPENTPLSNYMLIGIGIYIIGLLAIWFLSYWEDGFQSFVALPLGFAIAISLVVYDRYLNTGVSYLGKDSFKDIYNNIEMQSQLWPFFLFVGTIAVLMLVFYRSIAWRKRLAYPALIIVFSVYLIKSSAVIFLLGTGQISSQTITSTYRYNRAISKYVIATVYQIERAGAEQKYINDIDHYEKLLLEYSADDKKRPDVKEIKKMLDISLQALGEIQEAKDEAHKNRPREKSLDKIFWPVCKGLWGKHVTPLIEEHITPLIEEDVAPSTEKQV